MILHIKNPKDATRKPLELINEFGKVAGNKINAPKSLVSSTLTMKGRKEKLRKQSHSPLQQIIYKGIPIRLSADFSAETQQARRDWHNIFQVMKGTNLQPRMLYPARLSFRYDGEIKSFTDKKKLRKFSTTKPALQQMLKELL